MTTRVTIINHGPDTVRVSTASVYAKYDGGKNELHTTEVCTLAPGQFREHHVYVGTDILVQEIKENSSESTK